MAVQVQEFAMANLKTKSHGHLSDARVYGSAADNAERSRREISVRVRKLRVVEGIEELSLQFNRAFFVWPRESNAFNRGIEDEPPAQNWLYGSKNICYFSLIL